MDDDLGDLGALAADPLLDLARAGCASASGVPASRPSVRKTTSPSSVSRKRSSRGGAPVASRTIRVHRRGVARPRDASRALRLLGERLEMRLHRRRPRAPPRRSRARPRSAIACASSSERSPGQLEVERDLGAAVDVEDADVVDLADARRRRAPPRARARAIVRVARRAARRGRRRPPRAARAATAASTASAAAWPWPTAASARRRSRRRRSAARRPARIRSRRSSTGGSIAGDRLPRRLLGVRRRAVHQHVDVPPHQPRGRDQHEHGDEERRDRVGARLAGADERAARPARRASRRGRCRSGARSRAARRCRTAAPSAARRASGETSISEHDPDDDERPPGRVDLGRARAPASRAIARQPMHDADERRGRASTSAARCSAFPCPYWWPLVGRAARRRRPRRRSAARRRGRCPSAAPRRRGRGCRSRGRCRA